MANRFAVMGNPVAHSLSPFIHQHFAAQTGVELVYEKIHIDEAQFESQVSAFFAAAGKGLNITLPFKQHAFVMAEVSTLRCRQAKAANVLWLQNGLLQADNTDGIGLIRDLSRYLDFRAKRVLLLGAGGAARGLISPLLAQNIAKLTLANRSEEKARRLQAEFAQIATCSLAELSGSYDLIINATAASLSETVPSLSGITLKKATFCYDLAYSTAAPTAFVRWAGEQGCEAKDGLGMLVEQAAEAFFIWHGVRPNSLATLAALRLQM